MPTIEFESVGMAGEKTAEVPDGGDLMEICDDVLAAVAFSCRSASCGTCYIQILQGSDLLESADEEEQELLELLNVVDNGRLACRAQVKPGSGLIRIRAVQT